MAKKEIVVVCDDLDGTELDSSSHRPTRISIDGTVREIDLSDANRERLFDFLSPYIENGRRVKSTRSTSRPQSRRSDSQAIREWARHNGHVVADRGKLPADVVAAYRQAQ